MQIKSHLGFPNCLSKRRGLLKGFAIWEWSLPSFSRWLRFSYEKFLHCGLETSSSALQTVKVAINPSQKNLCIIWFLATWLWYYHLVSPSPITFLKDSALHWFLFENILSTLYLDHILALVSLVKLFVSILDPLCAIRVVSGENHYPTMNQS